MNPRRRRINRLRRKWVLVALGMPPGSYGHLWITRRELAADDDHRPRRKPNYGVTKIGIAVARNAG